MRNKLTYLHIHIELIYIYTVIRRKPWVFTTTEILSLLKQLSELAKDMSDDYNKPDDNSLKL